MAQDTKGKKQFNQSIQDFVATLFVVLDCAIFPKVMKKYVIFLQLKHHIL